MRYWLLSIILVALFVFILITNYRLPITNTNPTPISNHPTIESPTPTFTPPQVIIGLVGDLGLGRHITSTARSKKDFSWSFQGVSSWLLENDFTLANLESPIIANCPFGPTGTFTFCGDTKFIPYLSKFIFNLNNNHILNYGIDGLSQTRQLISRSFYDNFYTETVNGISFGFLGYDFITYPKLDKSFIISQIIKYNSLVDHLIVSIHWGNEYLSEPESWRVELAHQMIDAGADVIHGHHPHVWQGSEVYNNKYIFYSFGNFVFDQSWSYETSHSQIARLTFTKDQIIDQKLFPIEIKFNSQPWLMH